MPSFTDASFVAAGAGALLWALLATERSASRRTFVGTLGFVGLEIATAMRYTDLLLLAVASLAALDGKARRGNAMRINDPKCVAKTFPDYFEAFAGIVQKA